MGLLGHGLLLQERLPPLLLLLLLGLLGHGRLQHGQVLQRGRLPLLPLLPLLLLLVSLVLLQQPLVHGGLLLVLQRLLLQRLLLVWKLLLGLLCSRLSLLLQLPVQRAPCWSQCRALASHVLRQSLRTWPETSCTSSRPRPRSCNGCSIRTSSCSSASAGFQSRCRRGSSSCNHRCCCSAIGS